MAHANGDRSTCATMVTGTVLQALHSSSQLLHDGSSSSGAQGKHAMQVRTCTSACPP